MMIIERLIIHYLGRLVATAFLVGLAAAIADSYLDPGVPLHPRNWLGSAIMMSLVFVGLAPLVGWKKPWALPVATALMFPISYIPRNTMGLWVVVALAGVGAVVGLMEDDASTGRRSIISRSSS